MKKEKINYNSELLDKDINIYKSNSAIRTNIDNVNKTNIEKKIMKNKDSNKYLILSKNKHKIKIGKKINIDGKIKTPSLDFHKLKYREDGTIPSSVRKFHNIENENEDNINDLEFYTNNDNINNIIDNNIEDENIMTYRTESDILENEKEIISPEELFKKIISIDLDNKINNENIKSFLFNQIPKNEILITNININYPEKKENNFFNYNLEIIRNNKIYFFAKIFKYFPQMKIKIYYSDNYNNINNDHFSQFPIENNKDYNLKYVGKIISNMMRTNFIAYSGNKKNNYIKILNINYSTNFFGLLGIREMKVDKFLDNNIFFSLYNYKPEWDYQYNNYKIDFNGRVKQISKKNFILVDYINMNKSNINKNENKEYNRILQCGKINDKTYALDYIFPLTTFEAFCISITSLVTKISCE